jgi:VWFA-related protein
MRLPLRLTSAALLLAAVAALAQNSSPYLETYEVRIHSVEVIVTAADGKIVRGLGPGDFTVLEDGKAQPVTNFTEFGDSSGVATLSGGKPVTPQAQTLARAPRRFVLYLDELAVHPAVRQKILTSVEQLVGEAMADGDELMIITPAGKQKVPQPPTRDRAAALATLRRLVGEMNFRSRTQDVFENAYLERSLPTTMTYDEMHQVRNIYASMVKKRVQQRIGQLRSAVAALGAVPGKKVLVLITNSLPATPGLFLTGETKPTESPFTDSASMSPGALMQAAAREHLPEKDKEWFDLRGEIADVGRTAAANGVTIYPIQAQVPLDLVDHDGHDVEGRAHTPGLPTGKGSPAPRTMPTELADTEQSLVSLAETTGGRWFRGSGSISAAFQQVRSDLSGYYSLAYRATDLSEKPHRLLVYVKGHPDYTIRTRSEVVSKSLDKEIDDLTVANLILPNKVNELGMTAATGRVVFQNKRAFVPVIVAVPLSSLTLLPEDGIYRGSFKVHIALSGEKSEFSAGEAREQFLEIPAASLPAARKRLYSYTAMLSVPPGTYTVAVGVVDPLSRLTGFQTMTVDAR